MWSPIFERPTCGQVTGLMMIRPCLLFSNGFEPTLNEETRTHEIFFSFLFYERD